MRKPTLEWCVLKKHEGHLTLFYTKKNEQGFRGATKKVRLRKARYDAKYKRISVLVEKKPKGKDAGGHGKKILHFSPTKYKGEAVGTEQKVSIMVWWEIICPNQPVGTLDWVDLEAVNSYD